MDYTLIIQDDRIEEFTRILFRKRSKDFYEFIAFVCWYVFLIVCCVIPTACAYRRRRNAERLANAPMPDQSNYNTSRLGDNVDENNSNLGNSDDEISLIFFQSPDFVHEIRRRRELAQKRRLEAKRSSLASKMNLTKMVRKIMTYGFITQFLYING